MPLGFHQAELCLWSASAASHGVPLVTRLSNTQEMDLPLTERQMIVHGKKQSIMYLYAFFIAIGKVLKVDFTGGTNQKFVKLVCERLVNFWATSSGEIILANLANILKRWALATVSHLAMG